MDMIAVSSRLDPYTVADMEALLIAQEERIEKSKMEISAIMIPQANLVNT